MNPRATPGASAPPSGPQAGKDSLSLRGSNPKNGNPTKVLVSLLIPLAFTGILLTLGFASRAPSNPRLMWTFYGAAGILLCWTLLLAVMKKGHSLEWEYFPVASHYVQASVQFSIYVYWGWYWRQVYTEAPLILAQVAFLYALDALVTWSRGQKWRLGFGPFPIIFSTNLFMWFRDDWFVFQFLMVATGVLGKQFIRWRRDGRLTHIFNPSAFGLTLFSFGLLFTGTTSHTWGEQIATTQGLPPHIFLQIFLCGVVVQSLFYVTLLTASATAMLVILNLVYTQVTGVYWFLDANIPVAVFLGLHLLMTDPATTPHKSLGRILFGGLYGAGVFALFLVLDVFGAPTFYDKLLLVPALNLLTPVLDRLATVGWPAKFARWEAAVGVRKMNLGFMACWWVLFAVLLATGFVEAPHPGGTIAFWKKAAEENRPRAKETLLELVQNFESQNLDDPALTVGTMGTIRQESREQALGNLCNQVGLIYSEGKVVPTDLAKSAHFFDKACGYGNLEGCGNLAIQCVAGAGAGEQVDVGRSLDVLERAATTNGGAGFLAGYAYELGRGRAMDKAKSRQLYEKAATLGELKACKKLAWMELSGEGGPTNHVAAATWLQMAADQQDGQSCLYLARLYHNGDGVPRDETRAVALLKKACGLGVQPACALLEQAGKSLSSGSTERQTNN